MEDLPVEGILGSSFINQYVVLINTQIGTLTLQQEPKIFWKDFKPWTNKEQRKFGIPLYMHYNMEKNVKTDGGPYKLNQDNRDKDSSNDENKEEYSNELEIDLEIRNDFDFIENTKYRTLQGKERIAGLSSELDLSHLPEDMFQSIRNIVEH